MNTLSWKQTIALTVLGTILCMFALVGVGTVFHTVAQGTSWDRIPDDYVVNNFELPGDICYSIVDQTPYIIDDAIMQVYGGWYYYISYINTTGDVIAISYEHGDAFTFHKKYVAKAKIQPKCYELPTAVKSK